MHRQSSKDTTMQNDVYTTAKQLGVNTPYAVGHFNGHWQLVRLRDYAILWEGCCSFDMMCAKLFQLGKSATDVTIL